MPAGINGWLILNIALGIVAGEILKRFMTAWRRNGMSESAPTPAQTPASAQRFTPAADPAESSSKINWKEVTDFEENEDWEFLWDNVPDSAKETVRLTLEDADLRRRAKAADLWPQLWYATPEIVRTQLRHRWKEILKIPPRWRTLSELESGSSGHDTVPT